MVDADAALQGAKDIIAEMVSESEESRNQIRGTFFNWAREAKAPFSLRYSTMFLARVGPRPLT